MTERPIFRNIQHVPKVWGVTYFKIFITLGIGLLFTTVGFAFTSGMPMGVKIMALCLGIVVTGVVYGVCLWLEQQGAIVTDPPCLKNAVNSQVLSNQKAQFISKAIHSGRK